MRRAQQAVRRAQELAAPALMLAATLLVVRAVWPAPANAVDLFPVDDWLGSGIKKAGDVVLGPLKLGVKEIAALLAAIVGALADLLIPKSLVNAGLDGIKWLVQLPPVGTDATPQRGAPDMRMPHLQELRDTMTWIGITVLPLGIVISAGRAFLVPTADGDSPADILVRAVSAGVALLLYDWAWGVVTELSRLLTGGVLGLPWVADGTERMLETLVIGGATGSAVASEFVVPLMIMVAGTVLLGLLLVRVGLEVATAVLYVLGGLVFGLSVTAFGRRLLTAWLVAATAIVALPLLWSTVFAVGAALMLDAGDTGGKGGLASFVAQLYNVAAALAVFWIAIKLALGVFRHASGAITGIASTPVAGGGARGATPRQSATRVAALAQQATPAGLARFSQALRSGASFPIRHPVRAARAGSYSARHPVQATREAASGLASALSPGAGRMAAPSPGGGGARQQGGGNGARAAGHAAPDRHPNAKERPAAAERPRHAAQKVARGDGGSTPSNAAASPASRTGPRTVAPAAATSRPGTAEAASPSRSVRAAAAGDAPAPDPAPLTRAEPMRDAGRGPRPIWLRRPPKSEDRDGKETR